VTSVHEKKPSQPPSCITPHPLPRSAPLQLRVCRVAVCLQWQCVAVCCSVFAECLQCVCSVFAVCLQCVCSVFAVCLHCVCNVFSVVQSALQCVCSARSSFAPSCEALHPRSAPLSSVCSRHLSVGACVQCVAVFFWHVLGTYEWASRLKGVKTRILEAVKETMSWTREVAERGLSLLLRRRTECLVQVSFIYVWHTCE